MEEGEMTFLKKWLVVYMLIIIGSFSSLYGQGNTAEPKVLILYDTAGEYGWMGKANAVLLENLLGHFEANVTSKPAENYMKGELSGFDTVFYLGTSYLESLPSSGYSDFFQDSAIFIKDDTKSVVWINYNLDYLQEEWKKNGLSFEEITGYKPDHIEDSIPYNRVEYKGEELFKGIIPFATPGSDVSACVPDENNNSFACSTELVVVEQNTSAIESTIYATAYTTLDENGQTYEKPYIIEGGNFWFVGDIPFSYMYEEDRYLAFADLLHDMLSIPHEEKHLALMRLEDVNAVGTDLYGLKEVVNYMETNNIPFTIAAIPLYRDPLAYYNNFAAAIPYGDGLVVVVPIRSKKLSLSEVGDIVKGLYERGAATVVQHGYTHQLDALKNPYNGVTADDFEFLRVSDDDNDGNYLYEGPSHNDDPVWAKTRMEKGKMILAEMGIKAFAWEAPHYMAGPKHYRAIRELYPVQYSRLIYYPWEDGDRPGHENDYIGQYFPYLIHKDVYGYTIIPENLQNIEDAPNPGYRPLSSKDTIRFAKKLKVVRDGIGSFFYHPYLGKSELEKIVNGLRDLGYTFVSAPSLLEDGK